MGKVKMCIKNEYKKVYGKYQFDWAVGFYAWPNIEHEHKNDTYKFIYKFDRRSQIFCKRFGDFRHSYYLEHIFYYYTGSY